MEGNKKPAVALSDRERFPLIDDLSFLMKLRQDEYAPVFNFKSGDRLNVNHLARVNDYAARIRGKKFSREEGAKPDWIEDYIRWCIDTVPFYKNRGQSLENHPTISRNDIGAVPWKFVSDEADINDMLVYQTSGTTGPPVDIAFDPVSQACWIPQLQSVLDLYGIQIGTGPSKVAIALICSQKSTLTYASLSTYLDRAGILKINLDPGEWKDPSHRRRFLEKYNPEILTGDPFAFIELERVGPQIRPKALISSAMKLMQPVKEELERYFCCPVIDVYSLTECRMIAFAREEGYRAIRPDLYLEIFDPARDEPVQDGDKGELVVTGGINPFLPLIRYRTGDFCRLKIIKGIPFLLDLEGRKPTPFFTPGGRMINNIDVSRLMMRYPLAGFNLHQEADYSLVFKGWSYKDIGRNIESDIRKLFDNNIDIQVIIEKPGRNTGRKTVTYSSDLEN